MAITKGQHKRSHIVSMAYITIAAHMESAHGRVCLGTLNVDYDTGGIHHEVSLQITNRQMNTLFKGRTDCEFLSLQKTKEANKTMWPIA